MTPTSKNQNNQKYINYPVDFTLHAKSLNIFRKLKKLILPFLQ